MHRGNNYLLYVRAVPRNIKLLSQRNIRREVPAHICQIIAMRIFDILAGQLHAFLDSRQRQHEMVFTDLDQQAVDDRQGQRDFQGDGGAAATDTVHPDRTTQTIDAPLDHIHANPTSGNAGHLGRCGKSGGKNLGIDLLVRHFGNSRNQPFFNRLGPDGVAVQTGTVVADRYQDRIAGMLGTQIHFAGGWFSGCLPRCGHFDAVVDAVADDVYQRVVQFFDDGLVQLGFSTEGFHLDLFAKFLRQVAHQPFELAEGAADRQHAYIKCGIAQFIGQPLDLFGDGDIDGIPSGGGDLCQVCLHRNHLAD